MATSSVTTTYAYGKCRCGRSITFAPEQKVATCGNCGATVERPAKRRKAPDVVLPRP